MERLEEVVKSFSIIAQLNVCYPQWVRSWFRT